MASDLPIILKWWAVIFLLGIGAWPFVAGLFKRWENGGYLLSKAAGILITTFLVWMLGSLRLAPFGWTTIFLSALFMGTLGWFWVKPRVDFKFSWKKVIAEECIFLGPFVFWCWVKAHEPTINGLEKFMDYGFTQTILNGAYFPPLDMWYAGGTINYYYFGHLMMAVVTKLSGLGLYYGFNLMLATICGLTFSMSFAIGREFFRKYPIRQMIGGAFLIAFLVTFSGNLHTIYAFTKGYWGEEDSPPPFWTIMVNITDKTKLLEALNGYWYPNATRFIPYTIHEFPSYSFVVSDLHGHVLAIPLALLMLSLLVLLFGQENKDIEIWKYGVYGWVAGAAFMTNALDGPIYIALLGLLRLCRENIKWKKFIAEMLVVAGVFIVTVSPFLVSFKPFVSGVAVNCPPSILANKKIGPLIFEGTEKCQKSPLWMMGILWGFFGFCAFGLIYLDSSKPKDDRSPLKKMFVIWSIFSLLLIIFPEFFYFKDIYPMHFRSNTMFKLGYQVFIMMSFVSGYILVKFITQKTKTRGIKLFLIMAAPLLFLVAIYPIFSVRSYFNSLTEYQGLYGLNWMKDKYPDDFAAVNWLENNIPKYQQPVVLEAPGDSYTDYERISAFSGMPTVVGWAVHEWLWRGSYGPVGERAGEVQSMYESDNDLFTQELFNKYKVKFVVVGEMERTKYKDINEEKFTRIGKAVFAQGTTTIYQITEL